NEAGPRRRCVVATAMLVGGFASVVPFANPYRDNLVRSHTPFVNDAFRNIVPGGGGGFDAAQTLIEVPRPPVGWVLEDLLTFRIFALLRERYIPFESTAAHRRSLWSQLYGWTIFVHFPPMWPDDESPSLLMGRLCMALGLLPLAAVVLGFAARLRAVWLGL